MPTAIGEALDRGGKTKRDRYLSLFQRLKSERASSDLHWREIANFMLPRRPRFALEDRNQNDRRNQNIIDATGKLASRTLSAGMHSGLTNPARPWMKLSIPDPELRKFAPVKAWLHEVTNRILTVFAESNLYNVLPLVYGDIGTFGSSAMSILDDSEDLFRAYSYPLGSWVMALNARGMPSTFGLEYERTVRQVVEEFGIRDGSTDIDWSHLSRTVKNLWDRGNYEAAVAITWIVQPNDYADPMKLDAKYLPWSSCHIETGAADSEFEFLRESGFETFPFMCPRWDVTGEDVYGNDCPGMTALGDVKQLQGEQRKKGQLLQKAVDPPLKGPVHLRQRKISLLPGDFTGVDERTGQAGLSPIHEVRLEGFQHITADINDVRYLIDRAFYADLFAMLVNSDLRPGGNPQKTAREIEERHEEKLLLLGPVLERTNDELLDIIVMRTFARMKKNGLIPDPPPDLQGVKWNVEYTSILHQAQKLVSVSVQDRMVQSVLGIAPIVPAVLDKIDWDVVVDNYAEALGVDPNMIFPNEVAEETRAARQQAEQEMTDAQQTKDLAGAVAVAGKDPIAKDSALDRITGAMAGG